MGSFVVPSSIFVWTVLREKVQKEQQEMEAVRDKEEVDGSGRRWRKLKKKTKNEGKVDIGISV